MDWTDNYEALMAQDKQPPASPVWKPIGEAANDFPMFIEQIDGYRVPVRRFSPFFTNQYRNTADELEVQAMQNSW